jgi:ABC-2 type transport system permease protein
MSTLVLDHAPRRSGPFGPFPAFGPLLASEIKIAYRRPVGLITAIGVPLALLVIFGSIPSTTRPAAALGGISFFNLYVPTLLVFVLIAVGLGGLPQQLSAYRAQGVLRRMSTTPVSPVWLLGAQMTVSLIMAAVAIAILLGVGALAFHLALPSSLGGWLVSLVSLVLTVAATLGLGLCVAAVAGTPQLAGALQAVLFYPLAFFSGLYVPLQAIHSSVIHTIAKVLPTGAGFDALHASFLGHSPGAEPLLVLAGWAILSSLAAARLFRWE